MAELENILQEIFGATFKQMADSVQPMLPKIGLVLLILFVGWITAVIVKKVVSKLLPPAYEDSSPT